MLKPCWSVVNAWKKLKWPTGDEQKGLELIQALKAAMG
jgi:hypothetical protein